MVWLLNISVQVSSEENMMSSLTFWSKTENVAQNYVYYTNFYIKIIQWSFIYCYLDWGWGIKCPLLWGFLLNIPKTV